LNADGELRAIMGLTAEGTPVLQFLDKNGDPLWTAPGSLVSTSIHTSADESPAPAEPEASKRR
jgi:hypothetical protein